MTTITLAYEVNAAAVARVQRLLDDVALRDPNWNGAEFRIDRDEFTSIDGCDEISGAILLNRVQQAIAE